MGAFLELLELVQKKNGDFNPVNLHLGCGQVKKPGCINIDFPQEDQPFGNNAPDINLDIVKIELPSKSVDSIQLYHVFEHFSRGVALGLLINWNRWLKIGGNLLIQVPDAEMCCVGIGGDLPLSDKMKLIRHIAGSHEEDKWSFHIDQWFGERLKHTFESLNFEIQRIQKFSRDNGVFDVEIVGVKTKEFSKEEIINGAKGLLKESILHPCEQPLLDIWINKMLEIVK